jgi:hypothetical protein
MLNAILLGFRLVILVLGGQKQIALENAAMRQLCFAKNTSELSAKCITRNRDRSLCLVMLTRRSWF